MGEYFGRYLKFKATVFTDYRIVCISLLINIDKTKF